ncbi:hypothetical protein [Gymnodinialimonas hymeniacidonis]|uniref:hypothetical protein n=1 Tax=Gymnodinialimonas hymeniacidonis TaxID=3126508 RepID=UPI0034C699EB
MRPLLPHAPIAEKTLDDPCIARASKVIARMQAGGRTVSNPTNWRPAQSPWR